MIFFTKTTISLIFIDIYLTSSKHTPQINMSTFLDEAETSLDACRKQEVSRSVDLHHYCQSVIEDALVYMPSKKFISVAQMSATCNNPGFLKDIGRVHWGSWGQEECLLHSWNALKNISLALIWVIINWEEYFTNSHCNTLITYYRTRLTRSWSLLLGFHSLYQVSYRKGTNRSCKFTFIVVVAIFIIVVILNIVVIIIIVVITGVFVLFGNLTFLLLLFSSIILFIWTWTSWITEVSRDWIELYQLKQHSRIEPSEKEECCGDRNTSRLK